LQLDLDEQNKKKFLSLNFRSSRTKTVDLPIGLWLSLLGLKCLFNGAVEIVAYLKPVSLDLKFEKKPRQVSKSHIAAEAINPANNIRYLAVV
jgi:hypothetical protein